MLYAEKTTWHLKKGKKPERHWPKQSKKRLDHVKNLKHINGFILNRVLLLEGSSLKNERDMIFFLTSCVS
jgi:hypothetical protein